jgi:riboflavin kinase/FMN adenylyltransferase
MTALAVFEGKIIHGKGLGKTVGMPTANLDVTPNSITLPLGVYASKIIIDGETFTGLTNIGPRPSVDDVPVITVETLILDFDRDIYEKTVTLKIYLFIRPIEKFSGLQAVKEQVEKDKKIAREYFDEQRETLIA